MRTTEEILKLFRDNFVIQIRDKLDATTTSCDTRAIINTDAIPVMQWLEKTLEANRAEMRVSLPKQIENEEREKLNQVILKQKTQLEIKDDMINAFIILADKIKQLEARNESGNRICI